MIVLRVRGRPPVRSRRRVRDAASVAALYEVAEETGHFAAETELRVASLGSLDLVGAESGGGALQDKLSASLGMSGDMFWMSGSLFFADLLQGHEPLMVPVDAPINFAMPKSVMIASPSCLSSKILAGLRSRCTMPC